MVQSCHESLHRMSYPRRPKCKYSSVGGRVGLRWALQAITCPRTRRSPCLWPSSTLAKWVSFRHFLVAGLQTYCQHSRICRNCFCVLVSIGPREIRNRCTWAWKTVKCFDLSQGCSVRSYSFPSYSASHPPAARAWSSPWTSRTVKAPARWNPQINFLSSKTCLRSFLPFTSWQSWIQ